MGACVCVVGDVIPHTKIWMIAPMGAFGQMGQIFVTAKFCLLLEPKPHHQFFVVWFTGRHFPFSRFYPQNPHLGASTGIFKFNPQNIKTHISSNLLRDSIHFDNDILQKSKDCCTLQLFFRSFRNLAPLLPLKKIKFIKFWWFWWNLAWWPILAPTVYSPWSWMDS